MNIMKIEESKPGLTRTGDLRPSWATSKSKIYLSLVALSLAWTFQFTSYFSIANLQSTLNQDGDLGTTCLALLYLVLLASCFFFPSFIINIFGLKWGILLSQVAYLAFAAANFYPTWFTLVPGKQLEPS